MQNPSSPTNSARKIKLSLLQLRNLKQLFLPYGMDMHLEHVQKLWGSFLNNIIYLAPCLRLPYRFSPYLGDTGAQE